MRRYPMLAGCLLGAGVVLYQLVVRPWHLRWGASDDEVARPMPGDDEVPAPHLDATRAVTIEAEPDRVWPWLVQMGYRRAGFYSYRFDNAWVASPRRILPELQQLEVGDVMPTGPGDGFTVVALDPPRSMVLAIRDPRLRVGVSVLLDGIPEGRTRMVGRLRVRFGPGLALLLYRALFDPGDFIMMRKMFLGIKERAEQVDVT